ncbi:MAG: hypothetical protein O2805_05335 [Proteobacteria bacterium]|nr:hypothetical protein [Pseudomonadota bacterium]
MHQQCGIRPNLRLRQAVSDRLTLEAGAGEAQSIDILYSVEKH